jgi:hypothetical protein
MKRHRLAITFMLTVLAVTALTFLGGCSMFTSSTTAPINPLNPLNHTPRQQIANFTTACNLATLGVSVAHATGNLTGSDYATAQDDLRAEAKVITDAQTWLAANPQLADVPGATYPGNALLLAPLLQNFAIAAPLLPPVPAATQPVPIPQP